MSICSVAFVPGAPLLVPAVAGGSASIDDDLRVAAKRAVRRLIASDPAVIIVAAPTFLPGSWPGSAIWDFTGFGVPRQRPPRDEHLPWQLGIGAWLLDDAHWSGRRRYFGIAADGESFESPPEERTAILAIGDGSACRTEKAPGYLDLRAKAFDAELVRCLAAGDANGLAAIDQTVAQELLCAGLPVWRWVADALAGQPMVTARVDHDAAPYGVGYVVASWTLA